MLKLQIKTGMFIVLLLVIVLAVFPATGYSAVATTLTILPLGIMLGGFWFAVDYHDAKQ